VVHLEQVSEELGARLDFEPVVQVLVLVEQAVELEESQQVGLEQDLQAFETDSLALLEHQLAQPEEQVFADLLNLDHQSHL